MNPFFSKQYKRIAITLTVSFFVLNYFLFSLEPLGLHDKTVDTALAAAETISCNGGGSRTLTTGTYSNSDGSQFTVGADLTLNAGTGGTCTFTYNGTMTVASLTIGSGVTLTHGTNTNAQTNTLDIQSSGSVTISSGGSINVDGKGYAGGAYNTDIGNGIGYGGGTSSGFGITGTSTSAYSDSYSTGSRTSIITVTTDLSVNGSPTVLVDGNKTQNVFYFNSASVVGKYLRFALSSPRIFNEAIFYEDQGINHGIYQWQGSNNATDWTSIGSTFTLGQSTAQTQTSLSSNTTAYSYYQLLGTANFNSTMPWVREFEFKVLNQTSGGGGGHFGAGGAGGNSGGAGGAAYSATSTIGSGGAGGGASSSSGGAGGGLIKISASSTIAISGTLSADGSAGTVSGSVAGGGGAGGTINLTAGAISGTPQSVTVNGGAGGDATYDGGGGGGGYITVSYDSSNTLNTSNTERSGGTGNVAGGSGSFYAVQSSSAPTVTSLTPAQTSPTIVTVSTTVADANLETTSLIAEYSLDNSTWVSSTLRAVTVSTGAVSTSTGSISGIDTDTGSVTVSFEWNVDADIPNTADSTVYFRVIPNDGTSNGTAATSAAFAVDTAVPSAPTITTSAQTINTSAITITGTAEAEATVSISGGASTATGTATGGNYSISVSLTQDAANTLSVTASDSVFNTSTAATVIITEDSTAPSAPAITTSAQTVNASSITITGTAENNSVISITGGAATASTTASGGNYSVSVTLTPDSANTLSVFALDSAFNTSTAATVIITEDSTAPSAPTITTSAQTVDEAAITITGTAEADSTIFISGGFSTATGTATGGNYSISVSLTQDAANTLSVTASDSVFNTSTAATVIITEQTAAAEEDSDDSAPPGAAAPAPAPPVIPISAPAAAIVPVIQTFSLSKPTPISVGSASHTVTVRSATVNQITVLIQSEPILLTLKNGESREIDSDGDSKLDLKVVYKGLVSGQPKLEFISLVKTSELGNAVTINRGATETDSRLVTLQFNVKGISGIAVSNRADFLHSYFEPVTLTRSWTLSEGLGTKTVYVRFRAPNGGTATVNDSIVLTETKNSSLGQQVPVIETNKEFQFTRELKLLSTGDDVKQLQIFLKNKGHFNYPEFTTKFGSVTASALKKYQQSVSIKTTGVLDSATRTKINIELKNKSNQLGLVPIINPSKFQFTRELKLLSTGDDVKQLQIFLKNKGHFNYPEFTTKFGSITKNGLIAYQKSVGLKTTGVLDVATRTQINNL